MNVSSEPVGSINAEMSTPTTPLITTPSERKRSHTLLVPSDPASSHFNSNPINPTPSGSQIEAAVAAIPRKDSLQKLPSIQRVQETKDAVIKRKPQLYQNGGVTDYGTMGEGSVESSVSISASMSRYKYYNKLAPFPDSTFVMPNHVVPSFFFLILPLKQGEGQSALITIFSIWNTMMGTSIIVMPYAIMKAGFSTGMVIIFVMGLLTYYTCYLTMKTTQGHPTPPGVVIDFPDVCEHYLGKFGKWTCFAFSVVAFMGALLVYWVLMTNFLYNTGTVIHDKINNIHPNSTHSNTTTCDFNSSAVNSGMYMYRPPQEGFPLMNAKGSTVFEDLWDLEKTCPFWLIIGIFPLISLKSATFFTKFNVLGTVSIAYLLIFVIFHAAKWGPCIQFDGPKAVPEIRSSFPSLCGTLSLAMFIHNGIMAIMRNQKKPEHNTRDLSIAYFLVTMTYLFVGVAFYITFPHLNKTVLPDNFLNYFPVDDPLAIVARAFLLIQMICVFPLLAYILRVQVMHAFFGDIWPSLPHVLALNAFLLTFCSLIARFYPKVGSIISYVGASSGLALIFTLPCVVHMLKLKEDGTLTWRSIVIHSTLILIGVAIFISQFTIKQ